MKNSKGLAIIGASGMVGSDLIQSLKSNFENVASIDRKNYDRYRGTRFDAVINANGNSDKVWASDHILDDFEASTTSVYATLFDFPCKTYIYISSADIYPDHTSKKATNESKAINPEKLSAYGLHKYLSECIVRNFMKNYIILRCPMILGIKLKKGPIYDILSNSPLFVSEKSAFQIITTYELARIIYFLLTRNITKEVFNVGGRGTVLMSKISDYVGRPVNFPKGGKTHIYEADVLKLHKMYPLKTSAEYLQDFLEEL